MTIGEVGDSPRGQGYWRLIAQSLLAFWVLHLIYRVTIALLGGDLSELLDPSLQIALCFGFLISVLLCLLLRAFLHRGLAFGLGLAALVSLPASLIYAGLELTLYFRYSPELSRPVVTRTLADGTVMTATPAGQVTYRQGDGTTLTLRLQPLRQRMLKELPRTIAANTTGWYFFFFGLGALFVGLASSERLRAAERRAEAFQRLAQELQLRALRYQVNPHFLFNTLNSLSALVMTDRGEEAEAMILNISAFFRSTLALDPAQDITLGEELVLQRLYLDIEQGRFPDRLRVAVDIPDALRDARVPALILQPLVENAIKYGVALSRQPVTVRIAAEERRAALIVTVENDCPERVAPSPGDAGTGVGLVNVRERLAARYGGAASCISGLVGDGCFRVTLTLPVVRG